LLAFHHHQRLLQVAIAASAALVCLSIVGCGNAKRPMAFDDSHTAGDEKEQGSQCWYRCRNWALSALRELQEGT
jgi:hypothetical protein